MRYLLLALVLTGCGAKVQTVQIPVSVYAFELGYTTARIEDLCARKKLTPADCDLARDKAAKAKAALEAPPSQSVDWNELFGALVKLGMKAAI